jgi:DNA invertase Pin-like site-specific DNA recombinase
MRQRRGIIIVEKNTGYKWPKTGSPIANEKRGFVRRILQQNGAIAKAKLKGVPPRPAL